MRTYATITLLAGLLVRFALAAPADGRVPVPGGGYRLASTRARTPTQVKTTSTALEEGSGRLSNPAHILGRLRIVAEPRRGVPNLAIHDDMDRRSRTGVVRRPASYGGSPAGGGVYWALASWHVDSDNTNRVTTEPGANLTGVIQLTSSLGSSYISSFSNMSGTELNMTGIAQPTWATETLETYGASDYPTGSTVFSDINIMLANGTTPSVTWSTTSDPADDISMTVHIDGATNAEITITY
ncbi:hypothetical protein DFH07DRAFT_764907 [Mycena maculata]|uniref:Uncharacterized protein n=1 Tax=Mycena maculata TaxID=230809 RepID=A0AAD7KF62_9AGAR|nr:hypothetical protein DFH07DRAFT_764907 [Mycena maculata]